MWAGVASAHITLETQKAPAGSYYKAVLRVPHSCEGAATTAIRVQIPDGVVDVKPMPKPGWQLNVVKAKLAQPFTMEGMTITEGVKEVAWTGGTLPDDDYDEFVLHLKLPDKQGARVFFPTIQECDKAVVRWIEVPAIGKKDDDYKAPAPGLTLGRRGGDAD
jgi:uncharacterized protein YcnI